MSLTAEQSASLDLLLSYADRGWAILPLWGIKTPGATLAEAVCGCEAGVHCKKGKGKHPLGALVPSGVKNAVRDKSIIKEWFRRRPGCNWAVRCGDKVIGGHLLFLDVDPRNNGDQTLEVVQGKLGALPDTVEQESGGNGKHFAFVSDTPVHEGKLGPGLDVQGDGKYIVVAPSRHWTGGEYCWTIGHSPDDIALAKAPGWLTSVSGSGSPGTRPVRLGDNTARDTILGEAFALAGRIGVGFSDGCVGVDCPWSSEHTDARGKGQDTSTVILPPAGGSNFGGFSCKHSHCSQRTWQDVLAKLPPDAVAEAHRKYPPKLQVVGPDAAPPPAEAAPAAAESQEEELAKVRKMLSYKPTKGGAYKVEADMVNLITLLSYDPRWKGVLKFDEFAQQLRTTRPPPWHGDDAPREMAADAAWTDQDNWRMHTWLKRFWGLDMATEKCHAAAYQVAIKQGYNPLKDYLNGLKWDGVKRIDTWTSQFLGSDDTVYNRSVGRWWLVSGAARGLEPGCKADHLVIFEGPQGSGKSTTLSMLVPNREWYSDTPLDLNSKDCYVSIRGRWIVELGELASLGKADSDRAKAFFSSPIDQYRPPYGHEQIVVPRSCIFAGSVNHAEYLQDSTGNRRYWPIKTTVFDLKGIADARDMLWAEAVHVFKDWIARGRPISEHPWWPSTSDMTMLDGEVRVREFSDAWIEVIDGWTRTKECKEIVLTAGGVSTGQVGRLALGIDIADIGRAEQGRIAQVLMRGLSWERVRGKMGWVYRPAQART